MVTGSMRARIGSNLFQTGTICKVFGGRSGGVGYEERRGRESVEEINHES